MMKSIKLLLGICIFMLFANRGTSQSVNEAIVFGQMFYVTSFDTLKLKETRFELTRIEKMGKEVLFSSYYTDSEGKYLLTNIPFGKYTLKVLSSSDEVLFHTFENSQIAKSKVLTINKELQMLPPQYVSKKNKKP